MGYYIQGPTVGKARYLAAHHHAQVISESTASQEILRGAQAVVCVVSNGPFDSAALCYDSNEFKVFTHPTDRRPRTWLMMDRATAHSLCGYRE